MSDDALIAGAAAPVGTRWIRSTAVLDAGWVVASSSALIVSSFFALIDLPNAQLRTGADPLRFFVLGLPIIAVVAAGFGAARRSVVIVAAATGIVTPGFALAGSLSISLLLSEASAFADVGVAVSVGASLLGAVMLVRWFVYHPMPLRGDQMRPVPIGGFILLGLGSLLIVILLVTTIRGDTAWSASAIGQLVMLALVALVVMAAGATRTIAAACLAGAACASQVVAVMVVKAEQPTIPFDSDLVLRTGVAGLAALILTAAASIIGAIRASPDPVLASDVDDTESWRWNPVD